MANHKSSLKRIRANNVRRLRNRYFKKTLRTTIKKIRAFKEKSEVTTMLPKVTSMLDKLAKKGIIHKNKAANLKSKLSKMAQKM
ncbi:MAG: 30S ribosomal protein S20 [Bacteroidetes bacterium GWE2_29_8]|nr:MAG: 30S ribosomal protein S20 [Bacteroidetes bacterium GWE2_29_8]OFY19147.1 MAG: 30S ribosomal protein S20 [Bacteroidetes bacterium GWF2_29_10]